MTAADRNRYARVYDVWNRKQERRSYRKAGAMLLAQLRTVLATLEKSNPSAVLMDLPRLVTDTPVLRLLEDIYTATGTEAAKREYVRLQAVKSASVAMLTKDKPPVPAIDPPINIGFFSARWRQTMLDMARSLTTLERVSQITETTRKQIREVLQQAISLNLDIRQTAKLIRRQLIYRVEMVVDDVTGLPKRKVIRPYENRAILIARTETTLIANAGHALGAESTALPDLQKIWIASKDERTRESHRIAGRKKPIPKNELFTVGGRRMKYPGDPMGGANECINCRCTVAYVPAGVSLN